MYEPLNLYIDGRFIGPEGRDSEPVFDPATGAVIGTLPHASMADLDEAVAASARAFRVWKDTSAYERAQLLHRAAQLLRDRADAIAETLTREQGKVLAESRGEVLVSADIFDWNAEEARRSYGRVIPGRVTGVRQMVLMEPVGPCALFTPWNFPALTPARKLAAALAAGCTAVIKASEETPGTAVAIVRALHDAGVPAGVVNLVFGVPSVVSAHLVTHPDIRKISFTGSTPVGKLLLKLAADGVKRTTMELGGNAPVLVLADADPELAVRASVASKYRNAGQVCISPSRFYVHDSLYDRFTKAFVEQAQALKVSGGLDAGAQMGPLANARRVDAMEQILEDAARHGGRVVTGGSRIGNAGHFFAPTVVRDADDGARLFNDETFGPIAPISRFSDLDEVLRRANGVAAGLAAYAFTQSADNARAVIDGLEAGMVGINGFAVSTPETPFGGVKESGHGQEGGSEGLQAYLNVKFVSQA